MERRDSLLGDSRRDDKGAGEEGCVHREAAPNDDAELFVSVIPLFPLLEQLEFLWPTKFVYLGVLVEAVQPVSYVWNAHWDWGPLTLRLSEAVYFFQLPFWDTTYVHSWGLAPRIVAFWMLVVVCGLSLLGLALYARGGGEDAPEATISVARVLAHLTAAAMFQPACNFLLSMMVCDDTDNLWQEGSVTCWEALHLVHLIFGVLALASFFTIAIAIRCTVYNDSPFSAHFLARAHSHLDAWYVVYQLVTAVLYFELLAHDRAQLFAALHALSSFFLAVAFAATLPYYNQTANTVRVLSLFFTAAVATFAASPEWEITHRDADTPMLIAMGLLSWLAASVVCQRARVSPQYNSAIEAVTTGRNAAEQVGHFPTRLPLYDLRWGRHQNLEGRLSGACRDTEELAAGSEQATTIQDESEIVHVLCPYVSSVLMPSDVELCTRFLRGYAFATHRTPTRKMLAFASRIYTKGISKYPNSSLIKLHFVNFLHYYCGEHQQALVETRLLQGMECSWVEHYRLFLMAGRLKQLLKIRDDTDQKAFILARRLHKQTLQHMTTFWSKLLSEKFDSIDIAHLAKLISRKREEGQLLFKRAVRKRFDSEIAIHYSQFLEQVMLDSQAAQEVRGKLRDINQAKLQAAGAGAGTGPPVSVNLLAQQTAQVLSESRERGSSSKSIADLSLHMNIMFLLFIVVIAGFGLFDTLLTGMNKDFIQQLKFAGQARMLSQLASWYASEFVYTAQSESAAIASCANLVCSPLGEPISGLSSDCTATELYFPKSFELKVQFRSVLDRLREAQDKLTYGAHKATFGSLVRLYKNPDREVWERTKGGDFHTELTGLWQMGTRLITHLEVIYASSVVCMRNSTSVLWLRENHFESLSLAFNESLNIAEEQGSNTLSLSTVVLTTLFVVSCVIVFSVYLVLIKKVLKVGAGKMSTLSLFSLIPKNMLEAIHKDARTRLTDFDASAVGGTQSPDFDDGVLDDDDDAQDSGVTGLFQQLLRDKDRGEGRVIKHADEDATEGVVQSLDKERRASEQARVGEGDDLLQSRRASHSAAEETAETDVKPEENNDDGDQSFDDGDLTETKQTTKTSCLTGKRLEGVVNVALALSVLLCAGGVVAIVLYESEVKTLVEHSSNQAETVTMRTTYADEAASLIHEARAYASTCKLGAFAQYWHVHDSGELEHLQAELAVHRDSRNANSYRELVDLLHAIQDIDIEAFALARPWCQFKQGLDSGLSYEEVHAAQAELYHVLDGHVPHLQSTFLEGLWQTNPALSEHPGHRANLKPYGSGIHLEWSSLYAHEGTRWESVHTADVPMTGAKPSHATLYANGVEFQAELSLSTVSVPLSAVRYAMITLRWNGTETKLYQNPLEVSNRLLYSPQYRRLEDRFLEIVRVMTLEDEDEAVARSLWASLIGMHAAAIVLSLIVLMWHSGHPILSKGNAIQKALPLCSALMCVAIIVLTEAEWKLYEEQKDTSRDLQWLGHTSRRLYDSVMIPPDMISGYGWTGDETLLEEYIKFKDSDPLNKAFHDMLKTYHAEEPFKFTEKVHVHERRRELYGGEPPSEHERRLRETEMIATAYAVAGGLSTDVLSTRVAWNFNREVDSEKIRARFDLTHWYNETEADLSLPQNVLLESSRYMLHHPAYLQVRSRLLKEAAYISRRSPNSVQASHRRREQDLGSRKDLQDAVLLAVAVVNILVQFASAVSVVVNGLKVLSLSGSGGNADSGGRSPEALFSHLTSRVRMALLLVAVLLSVLFITAVVTLGQTSSTAARLNRASAREWLTARSMATVQDLEHALPKEEDRVRSRVQRALLDLTDATDRLYFGKRGQKGYDGVGDSKIDSDLFGSDQRVNHGLQCINQAGDGSAFGELGVDIELRKFEAYVSQSTYSRTTYPSLLVLGRDLMTRLEQSTQKYITAAEDQESQRRFLFVAVLIVAAVLLAVEYLFIFRPMIGELGKEEEGTRLMLKMIPQDVRESVGAINEFLETGKMTQDQRLQEVNEVVTKLSTVPTVVTDSRGTIMRFSGAATQLLGFEERDVQDENVKLIMPEEYARKHDQYLARYRRTGVKHYIGSSFEARAQRKDSTICPVRITLKEYRHGRKSIFIAFISDLTIEKETERAAKLNDAVSMTSSVPVICIDSRGGVLRWNNAAKETFGYSAAEMMGNNVKTIQPPEIARQHDGYLARYRRTGVRHVVNQKVRQQGMKKDGTVFPCEVFIKELKWKDEESIFIGYVRDVTEEFVLRQSVLMNDCVVETSVVPIIMTDIHGSVCRFSPAAERTWDYASSDVLQKNVKMLMPEEVASRHDGYLATYLRTGVKHIIDSTRSVKAMRKDGSLFDARVTVSEVKSRDPAFPTIYIGYVVDCTQELVQAENALLAKLIANLCPIPIITISDVGTIRTFNTAAAGCTGWEPSEAIGENITIIQPPEIAGQHAGYLERYLRTGQKRIIDTSRRVSCLHKNGDIFPCHVCVREVVTEEDRIYVGILQDIRKSLDLEMRNEVNDASSDLVTVPLIAMNSEGQVQLFSLAAVNEFGYERDEVLLHNVRMLMPDEIAEEHDSYLLRYKQERKTPGRKSTVVNARRRVYGLRKAGDVFSAEISVREIEVDDMPYYIAYVRNITEELQNQAEHSTQTAVVNLSPTPLIVIDTIGTISVFSSAATKTFGWTQEEAVGQNVKLLQPESVAVEHDRYLATYRETRVKSVIDTTRAVTALRKDRTTFPARIMVREISLDDGDVYVGYVEDTTDEYLLEEAHAINNVSTDLSPNPMISIGVTGKILKFSRAAVRVFGWTADEIMGKNIKALMPDSIAAKHDGYLADYRKTGVKKVIDRVRVLEAKRRDGVCFPVEVSVKELGGEEGQKRVYMGFVRDITELQMLEEEMKRSQSIVELSMVPLIVCDSKGFVKVFNEASALAFKYSKEQVVGKNIKMLQPPEVADVHDKYLRAYMKTGEKHVIDTTRRVSGRRAGGGVFPLEIMVREMRPDGPDAPPLFVGFLRDVADENNMIQAMMLSDAVRQMLVIPCINIDHVGTILAFSKSAEKTFGYTTAEIVGQNIKTLQTFEVSSKHDGYLQKYLQTGKKHVIGTTRESLAKKKDGTVLPVEISVREIKREGQQPNFVGYVRDLTFEKEIEKNQRFTDLIVAMSPTALISMDTKGIVSRYNTAAAGLFGHEPSAVIGENIKMLMPDEVASVHDGYLSKYLKTRKKGVIDSQRVIDGKKKSGALFPGSILVKEIQVEDFEAVYVGFVHDATETLLLKQQHVVNDTITSESPVPIIGIDEVGTVELISRSVLSVFDYRSEDEIIGKNVKMLMFPSVADRHDAYLANYLKTGKKKVIDMQNMLEGMRSTGEAVPVEVCVRELLSEGRRRYIGYARDCRPEKEAKQLQRLADFVNDISPVSILAINTTGTILKANSRASEFLGYPASELIGMPIENLQPPEIAKKHQFYLDRYRDDGIKRVVDTTRCVDCKKKSGQLCTVELMVKELDLVGLGKMFVGSLAEASAKKTIQSFVKLNQCIMDLVNEATIAINQTGGILLFNKEAESVFGCKAADVLGSNIKRFMPQDVADRHDGFLSEYARTGIKHVVDTTRDVIAQTESGVPFDARIMVREVKLSLGADGTADTHDNSSFFVAFVLKD
eukprot:TRINITY_DN9687_c0_g1_i1.p1 TRINITY_DN9687_c0_g1~~TRINITY_DN9687_c0_g1_i1.p1  ORF type:complete len:3619 (+),score=1022.79 TRINITY_DN9687_c0_g1_i1:109-10965(+)